MRQDTIRPIYLDHLRRLKKVTKFCKLNKTVQKSSGCGRRLMFEKSWILDGHDIFNVDLSLKLFVWKWVGPFKKTVKKNSFYERLEKRLRQSITRSPVKRDNSGMQYKVTSDVPRSRKYWVNLLYARLKPSNWQTQWLENLTTMVQECLKPAESKSTRQYYSKRVFIKTTSRGLCGQLNLDWVPDEWLSLERRIRGSPPGVNGIKYNDYV